MPIIKLFLPFQVRLMLSYINYALWREGPGNPRTYSRKPPCYNKSIAKGHKAYREIATINRLKMCVKLNRTDRNNVISFLDNKNSLTFILKTNILIDARCND